MKKLFLFIFFAVNIVTFSQFNDTTKYPWPVPPLNSSQSLTATFGEFRNTGSSDHFHNAVDIAEPNNNPVYPSVDGVVYSIVNAGYDSYINVKTTYGNKKKHFTYYHVVPKPTLYVGQNVVAGTTVIGTIYDGAGHVHLIEREFVDDNPNHLGNSINPVRPEGGLYPYDDTYSPIINSSSLKFFKDNSTIELPASGLYGNVDIQIKVSERNGTDAIHTNNGTYILGYRILSSDGANIIYEPNDEGVKYRFYRIPQNADVHKVFVKNVATLSDPVYWLTNGSGESSINTNLTVNNNYLNTDLLDEGNYILEVFTEDTRGNKSDARLNISVIKNPPVLESVIVSNDTISVSWPKYILSSLKGYRIYYSDVPSLEDWELAADESTLDENSTTIIFNSPSDFKIPSEAKYFYFKLVAVDSLNVETEASDIYAARIYDNYNKILIVDGFDRFGGTGSWQEPTHYFNTYYVLPQITYQSISSCANEAIEADKVKLQDYQQVFWFIGDESIKDNTLTNKEQYELAFFLEAGGKLFISGEDIGQDLDTKHNYNEFSDTLFYHQYLRANLIHDGLPVLFEAYGDTNSIFDDMHITFGETYPVEAADDIEPVYGAQAMLNYTYERDETYRKGGITYKGTFGNSSEIGHLVYLSFPFETIADFNKREELLRLVQYYFENGVIDVEDEQVISNTFTLYQNFPNPFNPTTTINYSITKNSFVQIKIFDVLGREISSYINKNLTPGNYNLNFNASELSSGVYFYKLIATIENNKQQFISTKKMILLK